MKFILLLMLLSFSLSGCTLASLSSKSSEDNAEVLSNSAASDSDEYYLQIAKDLFTAKQYKQAYQIATKLAENNNVEAQYLLGYMLYYGLGVTIDVEQGSKWINISADTGYRPAIEALIIIKHDLTSDKTCPTVNMVPENSVEKSK